MIGTFLLLGLLSFAMYQKFCVRSTPELPVSTTLSALAAPSLVPVVYPPPSVQIYKSLTVPKFMILNS
jgi:hypothetical protein